jgi:hypothetical protein
MRRKDPTMKTKIVLMAALITTIIGWAHSHKDYRRLLRGVKGLNKQIEQDSWDAATLGAIFHRWNTRESAWLWGQSEDEFVLSSVAYFAEEQKKRNPKT